LRQQPSSDPQESQNNILDKRASLCEVVLDKCTIEQNGATREASAAFPGGHPAQKERSDNNAIYSPPNFRRNHKLTHQLR
jgi:hypothetical protein